jgi:molybdopterin converting factor subunit 1
MTMTAIRSIHLRYFAILREQRGLSEETLETAASTPQALYRALSSSHPFTLPPERIRVAVNDRFTGMDTVLSDGDTVVFVPPVAGG